MDGPLHEMLARWGNFYLLTGTAAAALTGLQFIVQTLLASGAHQTFDHQDPEGGITAYGTPIVVHFSIVLVLSAVLCAPWPSFASLRATLGVFGAGALGYSGIVFRRIRRQQSYQATTYDWVWYNILPAAAYAAVVLAALVLHRGAEGVLFLLAAATLLLLCAAIHNAWDTITFLTVSTLRRIAAGEGLPPGAAPGPSA